MARLYDVVVWGATGFTGRLVCEHLAMHYQGRGVRWAVAGRNLTKLEKLKVDLAEINSSVSEVPILQATLDDPASLVALTQKTKVVVSTAGPYAQLGTQLVDACVKGGAHYCDITAEVGWMLDMIRTYETAALEKGVCIVHNCGYDSIPSDLTAFFAAKFIQEELNREAGHMDMVTKGQGGFSGGTIASGFGMLFDQPKAVLREVSQPYCLVPPGLPRGSDPPDSWNAQWVPPYGQWAAPGVMQFVNAPVVRKSAALLGYGSHFGYKEFAHVPGYIVAVPLVAMARFLFWVFITFKSIRRWVMRQVPQQGEGPSRTVMKKGFWRHLCYAQVHDSTPKEAGKGKASSTVLVESEHRHADPGYLSTSRLVLESALCLALEGERRNELGCQMAGFPTPAAAFGKVLIERLRKAGVTFRIKSIDGVPYQLKPGSFYA
eukprot:jgi/Botrbrau1/12077/Bobra.0186s0005.1